MAAVPPIGWGLFVLGLVSIVFEPLRLALWTLGDEVGGVGGVGGLTNQFSPSAAGCNATGSGDDIDTEVPYCFHAGWLGFTYFGGTMLLLFTLPLGISALSAYAAALMANQTQQKQQHQEQHSTATAPSGVALFSMFWLGASILWFGVPLAYYSASPFYQKDAWHMILGVSIAAAYPTSWHLSFVAIPSAGVCLLAPLLGVEPATLKACHVRIAWSAVFWAGVHALGEIVYLASQGMLGLFHFELSASGGSDNFIFILGLSAFVVLSVQWIHAFARRHMSVAPSFRSIHRALAASLLLIASAHWWPFAIFLAPAVACAATSYALESSQQTRSASSSVEERVVLTTQTASLAFFAAIGATVLGITLLWNARQAWMLKHPSDYYSLMLQIFPPAAVLVAFVLARGAATAVLVATKRWEKKGTVHETPLLAEEAQIGQEPPRV